MKIIHKDLKKGQVKVAIENFDDLWYLSAIIEDGDILRGKTQRKMKIGDGDNAKTVQKTIMLSIKIEKVEFHKYSNILRASGKIFEGTEDIAKGSYHTLNLEPNVIVSLQKQKFLGFQIEKLKEATKKKSKIMICVLDREQASFAVMKQYGYEILSELKGTVQKKDSPEIIKKSSFYQDIRKLIEEYDSRHGFDKIIVASIAFWKDYLYEELKKSDVSKKILLATCSATGKNAIDEVLKRPEVKQALKDDRIIKEINKVEEIFSEISKEGNVAYGIKEVKQAADVGAVSALLVTDSLIHEYREKEIFYRLDKVMKTVDSAQGEITIVSGDHDGGQKLDGLGGIAALLRYKVS